MYLPLSQWVDQTRRLSPEANAEPGRWYTARAEHTRDNGRRQQPDRASGYDDARRQVGRVVRTRELVEFSQVI